VIKISILYFLTTRFLKAIILYGFLPQRRAPEPRVMITIALSARAKLEALSKQLEMTMLDTASCAVDYLEYTINNNEDGYTLPP